MHLESMQRKELQRCLDWGSRDCFICEVDRVKDYIIGDQPAVVVKLVSMNNQSHA